MIAKPYVFEPQPLDGVNGVVECAARGQWAERRHYHPKRRRPSTAGRGGTLPVDHQTPIESRPGSLSQGNDEPAPRPSGGIPGLALTFVAQGGVPKSPCVSTSKSAPMTGVSQEAYVAVM